MPFGLTNAPSTFQDMMNHIFSDMLDMGTLASMDDILVYTDTEEKHDEMVREVLKRLQDNGLAVSPEKCIWKAQEVEFLGYIIGRKGIRMLEEKGEGDTQLENPGIPNRNTIVFGVHQLLQAIHPGLLPSSETTYRADQGRQGVDLECGSRCSLLRTKMTIHYGPDSSTLRPRKRSDHRN